MPLNGRNRAFNSAPFLLLLLHYSLPKLAPLTQYVRALGMYERIIALRHYAHSRSRRVTTRGQVGSVFNKCGCGSNPGVHGNLVLNEENCLRPPDKTIGQVAAKDEERSKHFDWSAYVGGGAKTCSEWGTACCFIFLFELAVNVKKY